MKLSILSVVLALIAASAHGAEEEQASTIASNLRRGLQSAGGCVDTPAGNGCVTLCFSEVAQVDVLGKGSVSMKDLQVGDKVFDGESYQSVYAFGHRDPTHESEFLQIHTSGESTLEITAGHLLFKDGHAVRADSIEVGDVLNDSHTVTKIGTVTRTGVYTPFTTNGQLMVNGIKASNYPSLGEMDQHFIVGQNVHGFSHLGVSPFRLLCSHVSSKICTDYNEEGIPKFVAATQGFHDWVMGMNTLALFPLQSFAMALYFAVAVLAWATECLFASPFLGMALFGAVSMMGVLRRRSNAKTV